MKRCLNCMEEYEERKESCPHCGWNGVWEMGECLEPGVILKGRYIVGTDRGRNPADILYIGWDAMFARKVLIMEYFPKSCAFRGKHGEVRVFETARALFSDGRCKFREKIQNLIQMDDTRGLLNVFGAAEDNGTVYSIWEYPGEMTLRKHLLEEGPYSLEQTEKLLMKISGPLMAAHRRNMYHGQLSLDCCYVCRSGNLAVGRFNDAGFVTGDRSNEDAGSSGVKADIFELAHIAGAALTGVELWEHRSVDDSLEELSSDVPEYVIDALSDAMSDDPIRCQDSLRRFVDQFLDEATIEMPSNRVYQQEEASRRPSTLWDFLRR